ncbi:YdgA family protein [Suttonella sp. R2A3]|uniref:DUF945 family protein n=1 Tax=Suttonella sp. R2A3 TaxID=2908648 RepID=UPI001F1D5882|nr:DUF945 family protein [Suttonella sp. R2A3]UJF24105.1 YdgA family protein [Suttonella sp. R2A3]
MHVRNLSLAIALGLGTVSAPLLIQPAAAAISMEQEELANTVESRFNNIINLNSEWFNLVVGASPMVKRMSYEVTGYERGEAGATATTALNIDLNRVAFKGQDVPKTITLNFDNNIAYNDELLGQDVIANIKTTLVTDEGLQQMADIDDEDLNKLQDALENVDINSQLLPEGKYTNHVEVKPFNVEEDGKKVDFQGLTVENSGNEADIASAAGSMHLDMKKLTVVNEYEAADGSDPQTETLTLDPFTSDLTLTKDGDLSFESSTLTLTDEYNDMVVNIDSITGEGSEVFFDKAISAFTGKQHYQAENLSIKNLAGDIALIANSAEVSHDIYKKDELYNTESGLVFDLDAESFAKLMQLPNLKVDTVSFSADTQRISADAYRAMNRFSVLAAENNDAAVDTMLQTVLTDLAHTEGAVQVNVNVDTDQGSATFAGDVKVKKDAVTDVQAWKDAFAEAGPGVFISLLEKSIDFDLKGEVPQDIINAVGLGEMMGMATGYVVKEGDTYSIHLESKGDGIKLNGNAIPMPQM